MHNLESDRGQLTDMDPICGPKLNPISCLHWNVGWESTNPIVSQNDVYYDLCDCVRLCVGRLQSHKSKFIRMLEVCG